MNYWHKVSKNEDLKRVKMHFEILAGIDWPYCEKNIHYLHKFKRRNSSLPRGGLHYLPRHFKCSTNHIWGCDWNTEIAQGFQTCLADLLNLRRMEICNNDDVWNWLLSLVPDSFHSHKTDKKMEVGCKRLQWGLQRISKPKWSKW